MPTSLLKLGTALLAESDGLLAFCDEVDAKLNQVDFDALDHTAVMMDEALTRTFLACGKSIDPESESELKQLEESRKKQAAELEAAVHALPTCADQDEITDWIASHMKMIAPPNAEPIELTSLDIVGAPSRYAVGQLRHWLGNRSEFYKTVMKRTLVAEDTQTRTDDDEAGIKEIEAMLDILNQQVADDLIQRNVMQILEVLESKLSSTCLRANPDTAHSVAIALRRFADQICEVANS